jgi:stage III sporulation protein AB
VLVITGAALMGINYALSRKKRLEELKILEWVVSSLEDEIRYHHALIYEACINTSMRFGQPFSGWLALVGDELVKGAGENNFQEIWNNSLRFLNENSHMKSSDIDELRETGRILGYLDIEAQERGMELEKERIHNIILRESGEISGKMKISVVLGFMVGILLVVLLL